MRKLFILMTLLATNLAHANEAFIGRYTYIDGTDHTECPGQDLVVKGSLLDGYTFYGATGLDAKGPFKNSFFFNNINQAETKTENYIYKTTATEGLLLSKTQFIQNNEALIDEDISFKVMNTSAVLEYKLIKNDPKAKQWRSSSVKCFYSKNL